jgi:hypothetical protein
MENTNIYIISFECEFYSFEKSLEPASYLEGLTIQVSANLTYFTQGLDRSSFLTNPCRIGQ